MKNLALVGVGAAVLGWGLYNTYDSLESGAFARGSAGEAARVRLQVQAGAPPDIHGIESDLNSSMQTESEMHNRTLKYGAFALAGAAILGWAVFK